jgi:Uma2 family endonuclease
MSGSEGYSVHFPDQATVPESKRHLELRTLLYQFLKQAFAHVAGIGCDQFVYWDPSDARACLAPDAFVHFGAPDDLFRSWKTWERGVPQVAVEIISDSDQPSWDEKLERYRRLGVNELVSFDPETAEGSLRIWNRVGDRLIERRLSGLGALSTQLGAYWVVVDQPGFGPTLRLSQDEAGQELFPTLAERQAQQAKLAAEAQRLEAEAQRLAAEAQRLAAEAQRLEAERRIAKLEAELKRRSS